MTLLLFCWCTTYGSFRNWCCGCNVYIDTESGFRDVVFITASYGLGEMVVQGAVNPDEFYLSKPLLKMVNTLYYVAILVLNTKK
jgi:hypothetical protein